MDLRADVRRQQFWLGGRIVVSGLLLGATLSLSLEERTGFSSFTPRYLLILIAATFVFCLGVAVALKRVSIERPRPQPLRRIAIAQVGWDLLLTTALIYVSGGATSAFTFLYGVVILMAALTLGKSASVRTTFLALGVHGTMVASWALGFLAPPSDQPHALSMIQEQDPTLPLTSSFVGLLVVSVLATNLSSRLSQAGGELARAEENAAELARLNANILRSLTSGIITTNLSGAIQTANAAACAILRADESDLQFKPLDQWLPWNGAMSGEVAARIEGRGTRHDGTDFLVGLTANALLDGQGIRGGTLVAFQDLTEVEELRQTAERAERLAHLGRLAAGLAHEIRNPLSSISGSVELIEESPRLDSDDKRLLNIVGREVARLENLVSDMLTISRPRRVQCASVDLRTVCTEVVAMARGGLARMRAVTIEVGEGEPLIAEVDPDQVRQVVWNLLKNAIEASKTGQTVWIRLGQDAAQPDRIFLEVKDEGEGISAQVQARLFEAFASHKAHGVGLGLAVVKQIVDAHHGQVHVENADGGGTCFRVTLPRAWSGPVANTASNA